MKRKYNRNENGHSQIYQFPCQIFELPFFVIFHFFSINGIKKFSGYVSVNVNHTDLTCCIARNSVSLLLSPLCCVLLCCIPAVCVDVIVQLFRYPAEERRLRRMLLQHRFVGESVISGADSLYDIALSEVGSFEELPGMHYVIPPGFEAVIDILRDNVPPTSIFLQHVVTNISWNSSDLCKSSVTSPLYYIRCFSFCM